MAKFGLRSTSRLKFYTKRHPRFIAIVAFFATIFILYAYPLLISPPLPPIRIVQSSYDWSRRQLHHPVASIQSLPRGTAKNVPMVQHASRHTTRFDRAIQQRRRQEVKKTMEKAWTSYKQLAWMRDELTPITGRGKDTFGGWAATLIDAMDTLWIMDMKHEFREAAEAVATLDWANVQGTACNMFETTIRHLGGLLSAYDLSGEPALLEKAIELGDMLYAGFDTPNHMPPFWFDFEKAKIGHLLPDNRQSAASVGTLSMEFTRLAQLTGDNKYYDAIARVTEQLFQSQNTTLLPGMWPTFFDLQNDIFNEDNTFTLGALSDSLYEYVLKMHILLGASEPMYEQLYRAMADTIIKNLLFRPMTPENLDILFTGTFHAESQPSTDSPGYLEPEGQHLACFVGGMFAIGGKVFNIPEHIDIGSRLTKGCIWAYRAFQTGIGPEIFRIVPCESLSGCEWREQIWLDAVAGDSDGRSTLPKGFQNARDPRYILRPEALESVFIMYRITGDEEYREAAWEMFQSIQTATQTEYGNAAINDVVEANKTEQIDSMESFWMAETLKYLYLIFSPSDTISLDDYVFNTECHPFRTPRA